MSSDREALDLPPADDPTDVGFEPTVRRFHDLYCRSPEQTWQNTFWLGTPLIKCPLDLWIYQEILHDEQSRPDVIVETGTLRGGSAHFMACMLDMIGSGKRPTTIRQPRRRGTSTARSHHLPDRIVGRTPDRDRRRGGDPSGRARDGDPRFQAPQGPRAGGVNAYAHLVTAGNYLIVEDTNIELVEERGRARPAGGFGEFLRENDDFAIDRSKERFMMTFAPSGYLRRKKA